MVSEKLNSRIKKLEQITKQIRVEHAPSPKDCQTTDLHGEVTGIYSELAVTDIGIINLIIEYDEIVNDLLNELARSDSGLISIVVEIEDKEKLLACEKQKLEESLQRIKKLEGLIPICSICKKIRTSTGYWQQVEQYIAEHSDAQFSHSYCQDCFEREISKINKMRK